MKMNESNSGAGDPGLGVSREMPKYKCHKVVHALKIQNMEFPPDWQEKGDTGDRMIVPSDEGYAPFLVTHNWIQKHMPEPGGYYVVYDDGYASFSPGKAFEAGYTLIG